VRSSDGPTAAAMLARSEQGTFFGASNYYGFVAVKP
jgi:hypothetical protein